MTKFSIGTADGGERRASSTSRRRSPTRHGKELGHVELDGGAAKNVSATTRAGEVHQFHARGDVAGIARAGDAIIRQLPLPVRSGFDMIRSLGITGDVDGSLAATATKGGRPRSAAASQAHVNAGDIGSIVVDVADFRGSASTASDATFRDFKTTLTNPRGHLIADVHIANGAFAQKGTHRGDHVQGGQDRRARRWPERDGDGQRGRQGLADAVAARCASRSTWCAATT